MKKWLLIAALLIAGFQLSQPRIANHPASPDVTAESSQAGAKPRSNVQPAKADELSRAFSERRSDQQVSGEGVVVRVLADDSSGSRHQRFLLRLPSDQTILIAHNIDLAPRLDDLRAGETVAFSGEYEWNERGGVVHWTHKDPGGRHVPGWLRRDGRTYQ